MLHSKIRSRSKQTFSIRLHGKDKSLLRGFARSTHNYAATNDSNHLCSCFVISQRYAADIILDQKEQSVKNHPNLLHSSRHKTILCCFLLD